MAARKARKPATGQSARRPHAVSAAGELKDREANPRKLEPQAHRDSMPVDAIRVGHRHRKDMGDLDALAASMAELGLLHPVVVRPDGLIIAGARRLRAAQALGWTTIPVTVIDLDAVVRGEYAENSHRKDFTLIGGGGDQARAGAAGEGGCEGADARTGASASGKFPALGSRRRQGRQSDRHGRAARWRKRQAIVDAAEAEPEKFGKLVEDMDRDGQRQRSVPAAQERAASRGDQSRAAAAAGHGPYRVVR